MNDQFHIPSSVWPKMGRTNVARVPRAGAAFVLFSMVFFGLMVAFTAQAQNNPSIWNPPGGITTRLLAEGGPTRDDGLRQPILSKTGRYLLFSSRARNILPGMPPASVVHNCFTPGAPRIYRQWYVLDRETNVVDRVSVNNQGLPQTGLFVANDSFCVFSDTTFAEISPDGRYIVYLTGASNLDPNDSNGRVDAYIFDRALRQVRRISANDEQPPGGLTIAGLVANFDTQEVAYICRAAEVCVHNLLTQNSRSYAMGDYSAALSRNMRHVVIRFTPPGGFRSVVRLDLITREIRPLVFGLNGEPPNGGVENTINQISDDGSRVLFQSYATNLAPFLIGSFGDNNYFIWREGVNSNELATVGLLGQADSFSRSPISNRPRMTGDGRYVAFVSRSLDLTPLPVTSYLPYFRLYIRDLQAKLTYPAVADINGGTADAWGICDSLSTSFTSPWEARADPQYCPSWSGDGLVLAFSSYSDLWVAGDEPTPPRFQPDIGFATRFQDVFVKELDWSTAGAPVFVQAPSLQAKGMVALMLALISLAWWQRKVM
jgi:WD40-like Beta Propeller Repeat